MRPRRILLGPVPVFRECPLAQERHIIDTWGRLLVKDRDERSLDPGQLHLLRKPHPALFVDDRFHGTDRLLSLRTPSEEYLGQWHFRNDYRADERLVSRVLLSPGPHQAQKIVSGIARRSPRSGVFLVSARSLSESGGPAALS